MFKNFEKVVEILHRLGSPNRHSFPRGARVNFGKVGQNLAKY